MQTLTLWALLFGFYGLLSGQFHSGYLMGAGAVACLLIALLSRHMGTDDDEGLPIRYWWGTALYVPWLIWQVVLANVDVARRVWSPTLNIQPQMIEVPHSLRTPYGLATYTNSITLTPGTVTVAVEEGKLPVSGKETASETTAACGSAIENLAVAQNKIFFVQDIAALIGGAILKREIVE